MSIFQLFGPILVLVHAALAGEFPTGCVTFENRVCGYYLDTSSKHDNDRRHVTYGQYAEPWMLQKLGDLYRIKNAKLGEELYESEQYYNGNYVFTWIPKNMVRGGGWYIYESDEKGFFYIKNEKFEHCLHSKPYGNWIGAYKECEGNEFKWKIESSSRC